ncbi:hypothetical protein [Mucilaginibacter sp.]|uniref:hypothetical protein n=1 Tax=Mucilaginibacter sp. TaxID=1882438 RepID=UPI002840F19A|nr:hypothetical protein [Mucilaginibacter sp.]MDR3695527.1 hypothetical protein [Mucilaginibacter sp.]
MTTTAIRQRLYDYIRVADDKKIKAIYTLLEDQMVPSIHWSEDEDFVAELDERVRRYEAGIDPAFSIEEAKSSLNEMKKDYLKTPGK